MPLRLPLISVKYRYYFILAWNWKVTYWDDIPLHDTFCWYVWYLKDIVIFIELNCVTKLPLRWNYPTFFLFLCLRPLKVLCSRFFRLIPSGLNMEVCGQWELIQSRFKDIIIIKKNLAWSLVSPCMRHKCTRILPRASLRTQLAALEIRLCVGVRCV